MTSLAVKLEASIGALNTHLAECALIRRETTQAMENLAGAVNGVRAEVKELKGTPMKAVRWLGAIIVAGAALTNIVTYVTQQETAHKATEAVETSASTSTAATNKLTKKLNTALGYPANSADP